MYQNIYICLIDNTHLNQIKELDKIPHKNKAQNTILRVKTYRSVFDNVVGSRIGFTSNIIFDVTNNEYLKNRFNGNDIEYIKTPYNDINLLFSAINDVNHNVDYEQLYAKYNKSIISEAVYLTGKYSLYSKFITMIDYDIIRYQYGEELSPETYKIIISDYPEILLKNI